MNIILASNSPRRKELLKYIYPKFNIVPADIDETVPNGMAVTEYPQYIATQKCKAVAKDYLNSIVIACDTTVIYNNTILRKPKDVAEATDTLTKLSGNVHQVTTGVCVYHNGTFTTFDETTKVKFNTLSNEQISEYISTKEPFDKAGGYGIQGLGALLVEKIDGDYYNVVGLPISKLNIVLTELGLK